MPFVSDIPIDCAAVEATPIAFHADDARACWRYVHLCFPPNSPATHPDVALEDEIDRLGVDALRGPRAAAWLAPWTEQCLTEWPYNIYGNVHFAEISVSGIIAEISQGAWALSMSLAMDIGGQLVMMPSWADDFNRWSEVRESGVRLAKGAMLGLQDKYEIVCYAADRGFSAVKIGPSETFIIGLDAICALYPLRSAPPSIATRVRSAFESRDPKLTAAALVSHDAEGYLIDTINSGLEWFSPAQAAPWLAQAQRYLAFLRAAASVQEGARDMRSRTAASLDLVLGLRRYLGVAAQACYASCGPFGRRLEMGARMMPVPGPSVAGMVRPRGMEDWPDALVELAMTVPEYGGSTDLGPSLDFLASAHAELEDWCNQDVRVRELGMDAFPTLSIAGAAAHLLYAVGAYWPQGARAVMAAKRLM